MMDIVLALQEYNKTVPGSWTVGEDYSSLIWYGDPALLPTEAQLQACYDAILASRIANQYQELRKAEYPSIPDQLDILYHQGYDGWHAVIEAIKLKYPKPL